MQMRNWIAIISDPYIYKLHMSHVLVQGILPPLKGDFFPLRQIGCKPGPFLPTYEVDARATMDIASIKLISLTM